MKKTAAVLLVVILLVTSMPFALAGTLGRGDRGAKVSQLKHRLYEMGYFSTKNLSNDYNSTTVQKVRNLQKMNGLKETGKVTDELWELIFSDQCIAADGTMASAPLTNESAALETVQTEEYSGPVAAADVSAPLDVPGAPERDEKGFLVAEDEFVVQQLEEGFWAYLSRTLQVVIHRYWDEREAVMWFACDVRTAGEEQIRSLHSGGKYLYPRKLAREGRAVLAFNDDNHDYRINQKMPVGIVIRNGKILSSKTKRPAQGGFPKLEMLACFADGSMKCYNALDHTADELLEMGATNVLAFGPILVTNGQLGEHMRTTEADAAKANYYHYREPRIALGMVEPGHYIVVNVTGRYKDKRAAVPGAMVKGSKNGVYLDWVALKMLELGATEALNLDGGWTTSLCFLGESLNMKYTSSRKTRYMMGFGESELVAKD